jgi:hypothetical protein
MDDADRAELNAAIAAHCEWLERRGVRFVDPQSEEISFPPESLTAQSVDQVLATRSPEKVVGAVLTALHVLCSLRTRVTLSEERARLVRDATDRINNADYLSEAEKVRHLAIIAFGHDELHIKGLMPALERAESILRTVGRRLQKYVQQVEARHAKAADMVGAAISTADLALAQWMFSRGAALENDFAFFRRHVEGQQFAPHKEPLGAKAWHQALNAGLETLKAGGMKSTERRMLFPASFKKTEDADEQGRQRGREYKARKRAKKRNKSKK